MTPTRAQVDEARALIKAVFDDKEAEINGRKYQFLNMTHKQRRKVFAFFTSNMRAVQIGDMGFLDSPGFEAIEKVMHDAISLDGSLLSKLGDVHWEKYPGDYLPLTSTAMQVISLPFMDAAPID
jgi:hypothetical protein